MNKNTLSPVEAAGLFTFKGNILSVEPYGEGHINDTYLVKTGPKDDPFWYILQRLNTRVFKDARVVMDNIIAVTTYLHTAISAEGGDPDRNSLTLVPPMDGGHYIETPGGEFWRAYLFIRDTVSIQTVEDPGLLAASARAFGHFTRMLHDFPAETLHETIHHFHDTPNRMREFKAAVEADVYGRAGGCKHEIEAILLREADCSQLVSRLATGELPLRVTHNDTKLNNVLIDPKTREGICVIDLDTVMPGLIHYDFGDAIRTGATTAAEDETDLETVKFDLGLYQIYSESYLGVLREVLTDKELETLPWGARLMTLENGIRFLTDFLQGDVYYKIHHPGHNLDRARNQLKLVTDIEDHWDEIMRNTH